MDKQTQKPRRNDRDRKPQLRTLDDAELAKVAGGEAWDSRNNPSKTGGTTGKY